MRRLGLLFATLLFAAAGLAGAGESRVPKPVVKIENPGQCIAPAEEMRKNHMVMLKHRRDQTMRAGVRGGANAASLNACIDCHASKQTGSVLGGHDGKPEGFCDSCHAYAAVKLDCWDCHQPKSAKLAPAKAAATPAPEGVKP